MYCFAIPTAIGFHARPLGWNVMFGFDIEKLLVIAVVALVVIGPKDLPGALGRLGRTLAGLRRMVNQYRAQFDEMIKDTEFEDVRREFHAVRSDLRQTASSLTQGIQQVPAPPRTASASSSGETAADAATPAPGR